MIDIGDLCQYANCANQSSSCANLTTAQCSNLPIRTICPKLCNQTICRCGIDSCLNNGVFNDALCTCKCPIQFGGQRCEKIIPDPIDCNKLSCKDLGELTSFCPTKCLCEPKFDIFLVFDSNIN